MIKKIAISIIFLILFSCDSENFQNSIDCMGDSVPIDCSDTSLDGCAYYSNACGICVGGSSTNEDVLCDCMGDPIPIDCSDTSIDGCADLDVCGVCLVGSSINEDAPCICPDNFSVSLQSTPTETICVPNEFIFYTTTQQAGYIFQNIIIEGVELETSDCENPNDCDWVGAFNGDVCVGAAQWTTDVCANGICSINVMGNDYGELTPSGYMNNGEYPTFKIYDVSDNLYYMATPSEEYSWVSGLIYVIPLLSSQR